MIDSVDGVDELDAHLPNRFAERVYFFIHYKHAVYALLITICITEVALFGWKIPARLGRISRVVSSDFANSVWANWLFSARLSRVPRLFH